MMTSGLFGEVTEMSRDRNTREYLVPLMIAGAPEMVIKRQATTTTTRSNFTHILLGKRTVTYVIEIAKGS